MNNRVSVATIDSPEFINLQPVDINPLMSKCEIKVLYVGQNRNRSAITKEVATQMSKTLRGCPIVGQYIERKEDFGDHGDQVIIDGEGVKFNKLTKPYGFVAPDAKVWFKFFEDQDEFGNTCIREYLMTEGYLWTGQFEECQRVLDNSNPQSMELDEKTLKGFWSEDINKGVDFFIINDAVFSKLCILGDDVEPCFEGANVSAPNISSNFSMDNEFTNNLFDMMNELKFALNNGKGGAPMQDEVQNVVEESPVVEFEAEAADNATVEAATEVPTETPDADTSFKKKEDEEEKDEKQEEKNDNADPDEKDEEDEDKKKAKKNFAKKEDEKEESDKEKSEDNKEDKKEDSKDDEDEKKKKYALLESELETLKADFAAMKAENEALVAFKQEVEMKEKDELIASFYMLSDEDKKNVIENKATYSLKDIKAELSMICVDKKVSFSNDDVKVENELPVTYNLNGLNGEKLPEWLAAVEAVSNNKN